MKINKNTTAFTLIELLVAITIVIIMILGTKSIDFKYISDKQKLEIFTNKVISEIEKVRNNTLIGKGIGTTLVIPKKWKIEFSRTSDGIISTSYTIDGTNWISENNIIVNDLLKISSIKCINVSGTPTVLNILQKGTIFFEGGKYELGGDCTSNFSNIEIETYNKGVTNTINFDVISGLIKK